MIDIAKANRYIESKLNEPFVWGTNDCNTFIVEYFDKVLGTDLLKIIYFIKIYIILDLETLIILKKKY